MNIKIKKNYRYVTALLWYIAFLILASAISYLLVLDIKRNLNLYTANYKQSWLVSVNILIFITIVLFMCKSLIKTLVITTSSIVIFVVIRYEFISFSEIIDQWLKALMTTPLFIPLLITITISFFYILMIIEHILCKIKEPALVINQSGIKDSGVMGNITWDNINGVYILNAIPDKELYIDIKNIRSVSLRPFDIKKSFFQVLSPIISKRYVHKIEISTKQASTITWTNLRMMLSLQNKLLSEFPGKGFIKNKELTIKELEFSKSLQLEERLPIWKAISNLFLHIEIEFLYDSIAQTLANSQYSIQILNDIYSSEVAPICYLNLFSLAGQWSGFSEENLTINIVKYLYRQKLRNRKFKFGYLHTFMTRENWQIIIDKVEKQRAA